MAYIQFKYRRLFSFDRISVLRAHIVRSETNLTNTLNEVLSADRRCLNIANVLWLDTELRQKLRFSVLFKIEEFLNFVSNSQDSVSGTKRDCGRVVAECNE
jgi:hypothetical protein